MIVSVSYQNDFMKRTLYNVKKIEQSENYVRVIYSNRSNRRMEIIDKRKYKIDILA